MRDLIAMPERVNALDVLSRDADVNGVAVEHPLLGATTFIVTAGAAGITLTTSNYIALELEESDDGSTGWTDVAASDMYVDPRSALGEAVTTGGEWKRLNATADEAAGRPYAVGYTGSKRYVRLVANFVGTHGAETVIGAIAIRHHLRNVGKQPDAFTAP